MSSRRAGDTSAGPGVLDALSLLAEVADELVVRSVRDSHRAIADRVRTFVATSTRGASRAAGVMHRAIAEGVYGGLGVGLRGAARGLDAVAATGAGPRLEDDRRGRFLSAAVNGLIGDRLAEGRPRLAIEMAARVDGRDVSPTSAALAAAYPRATGRVVVLLHTGCARATRAGARTGRSGARPTPRSWPRRAGPRSCCAPTSGLPLRENGVALAALVQRLVEAWPVPVERIALVGHSMGALVSRAAGAVATADGQLRPWTRLVTDVVMLGAPHFGAPMAVGVGHGSRAFARLPETAAFGRILDWRSRGVRDLVVGLGEDVAPLPHAPATGSWLPR